MSCRPSSTLHLRALSQNCCMDTCCRKHILPSGLCASHSQPVAHYRTLNPLLLRGNYNMSEVSGLRLVEQLMGSINHCSTSFFFSGFSMLHLFCRLATEEESRGHTDNNGSHFDGTADACSARTGERQGLHHPQPARRAFMYIHPQHLRESPNSIMM